MSLMETGALAEDFQEMSLDWREVSKQFPDSIQPNGIFELGVYKNETRSYDLSVRMAAATCVHPSHQELGVTTGKPRVVGFFDCMAHAEVMEAQGPLTSIGALDRGDDYDEIGLCTAYVFQHPVGKSMTPNGCVFQSGTMIKAGEQLLTQELLSCYQPVVMRIPGWCETPLFARGDWWKRQQHPIKLPKAVCGSSQLLEHAVACDVNAAIVKGK